MINELIPTCSIHQPIQMSPQNRVKSKSGCVDVDTIHF